MRVLLAVDGSRFSEAATRAVIARMKPGVARMRVLHVTEPVPLLVPGKFGLQGAAFPPGKRLRRGRPPRPMLG